MKEIKTRRDIEATVKINGSKSLTHRALIASSLAQGESRLGSFLSCEDTFYTVGALREMGSVISIEDDIVTVKGTGGSLSPVAGMKPINLGDSGTSFRLLLSVAALGKGSYLFDGSSRMRSRPIGDLVKALNMLGVEVCSVDRGGFPPVLIKADGIPGGRVKIPGNISSQYISSLLLVGPYTREGLEIDIAGALVSRPYVDLTIDVMKTFGVDVENKDYKSFRIPEGGHYKPCRFEIEGDVSAASYFWGAAAITGGKITTKNICPYSTRQGDINLLHIMEKMGCIVERKSDSVTIRGENLEGVDVDMSSMPDMVPTLAAVALFARGKTFIRNVSHLRHKESDRLGDTVCEWSKLGANIEELDDGLVIQGGVELHGADIDPHNDHRLAMSLAMVGLRVQGIRIINENCVGKSFPMFWEMWNFI
ncbi:MAG: 3-phosphoshikimate 1-carboxyvinyltransferase [Deltaproteobacteria bacterium]|nr:3-phosphoshikimate 1-carboxyvinyltransferase [Deltaproteobacteria bacterium]